MILYIYIYIYIYTYKYADILLYGSMGTINFQMFKQDLEKAEKPEIKLPTSIGSLKKQESSRKTSALLTTSKLLTVWITTNYGKFFKR